MNGKEWRSEALSNAAAMSKQRPALCETVNAEPVRDDASLKNNKKNKFH